MFRRNGRPMLTLALLIPFLTLAGAENRKVVPLAVNPSVTMNVDVAADRHPIDERIYGASFASSAAMADLGITINRWGGNAYSRHNWEINVTNRAKDFYFENLADPVSVAGVPGQAVDDFIAPTFTNGAQAMITVPLLGLLPWDTALRCGFSVLKYGAQTRTAPNAADCGNGHFPFVPPAPDSEANRMRPPGYVIDPADTTHVFNSAHQANWIQHLVTKWGAASAGGVRYYGLDNEPALWSFDHWDVHPQGSTYDEVWGKWQDYGVAIKGVDPGAMLTGPEEYGWSGYFMSGADIENGNGADRAAHGDKPYIQWLLEQAKAYENPPLPAPKRTRVLDILTVHYYPQGNADGSVQEVFTRNPDGSQDVSQACQLLRNRSTRALWDPAYVNESWIGQTQPDNGIVKLIPRMKDWATIYPGTQIGLTEYNWGADDHINGGTAQADVMGILGREGLDVAVRWDTPPSTSYTYHAFKLYRNYDGARSRFGNTSVRAGGPNPDNVAVFAAQRSSDRALTIMIISKSLTLDTPATINLTNFAPSGAPAQSWQLRDDGNALTPVAIVRQPDVALGGSSLSLTLPPQSITLLVVAGGATPLPKSDFNADGHSDILWRNMATGQNVLWTMDGTTRTSFSSYPTVTDLNWKIQAVGDYNGDLKPDLAWRNTVTGQNVTWFMDGSTMLSFGYPPDIADTNWNIQASGDLNRDGKFDLLWRNAANGLNVWWYMSGVNLAQWGFLPDIADANWKMYGSGDLDGDSKWDIVWRNSSNGLNVVWMLNGNAFDRWAFMPDIADLNWKIQAVADYNLDGKADLIWRNMATGQNVYWIMNGPNLVSYGFLPTVSDLNWQIVGPR